MKMKTARILCILGVLATLGSTRAWAAPVSSPTPNPRPSPSPASITVPTIAPPLTPSVNAAPTPEALPWTVQTPPTKPIQPGDTVLLGLDGTLDVAELLEYARATHPRLRIYQAQYAQAVGQLHLSEALYVPTGTFSVTRNHTYTQNGGVGVPTPTSPALPATVLLLNPAAQLSYLLSDGGERMNSVSRDRVNLLTSVFNWRNEWRQLSQSIETDYLSVVLQRMLLEVQEEGVRMADDTLKQAEGLFRGGRKTRLDVLQSQADLEGARAQYVAQKAELAKAWARLGADVGAPMNEFARLDALLSTSLPLPPEAQLLDMAFSQRSDVLGFANQIAYQRWQIRVNKTQLNPTLSLLLSYGFTGADFPQLVTWQSGLTLTVPLTQGPTVRARNEQAEGTIVELLARIYDLRLTIIGTLSQSWVTLQAATEKVTIDEAQVREAEQAYRLAARRYVGGISQYIEVTNARQVLNNARVNLANARSDCRQAEINMLAAIEAPFPALAPITAPPAPAPPANAAPANAPPAPAPPANAAPANAPPAPAPPAPAAPAPSPTPAPRAAPTAPSSAPPASGRKDAR